MDITSLFYKVSTLNWILISLYVVIFIFQLIYYLYLFSKPYQYYKKEKNRDAKNTQQQGISVIITAKNEAENLKKNLPAILTQDYPLFQVVVVDNCSTDNTKDLLKELKKDYPHLYTTFIPVGSVNNNDKKLAITIGIKAAKYDILLFTEPDTKPLTKKWVSEYANTFNSETDIVIGACQIKKNKGLSGKYIALDNVFSSIKYLSFAVLKKPFMGIGRNMAIRKKLFFDKKGFREILNIKDGEDNVFINKLTTNRNTRTLISHQSMVQTDDANQFSMWRHIKAKYIGTRQYLTTKATRYFTFELILRYSFYLLFVVLSVIGIITTLRSLLFFAIVLFITRFLAQMIVINKNSKMYNAGNFYFTIILYDLFSPIMDHLLLKHDKR